MLKEKVECKYCGQRFHSWALKRHQKTVMCNQAKLAYVTYERRLGQGLQPVITESVRSLLIVCDIPSEFDMLACNRGNYSYANYYPLWSIEAAYALLKLDLPAHERVRLLGLGENNPEMMSHLAFHALRA